MESAYVDRHLAVPFLRTGSVKSHALSVLTLDGLKFTHLIEATSACRHLSWPVGNSCLRWADTASPALPSVIGCLESQDILGFSI